MIKIGAVKLAILELLFFSILTICYIYAIIPFWGYKGFENNFSIVNFGFSLLLLFTLLVLGLGLKNNFTASIWHIIFNYLLFPQIIYFFVSSGNFKPVLSYLILLIILFIFSKFNLFKVKGFQFNIDNSKSNFNIILILSLLLTIPFFTFLPQINFSNLLLLNIYETRSAFRDIERNSALVYLISILARVIYPILLIIAYEQKRWGICILIVVLIGYLFLASGAVKSIFFGMFVALFFYAGKQFIDKVKIFIWSFVIICIVALVEYQLLNTSFLTDLTIRRIFFVPPYFEDLYYDYFTIHDKTFYSHSFLKSLLGNESDLSISREMGYIFTGDLNLSANVGLIVDGFISLGWLGVIIHSLIFGFFIKSIELMNISIRIYGVFVVFIYYANTAFIGTFFITHGFLFLVVFTYFTLRKKVSTT